jgi:hypothetical protein
VQPAQCHCHGKREQPLFSFKQSVAVATIILAAFAAGCASGGNSVNSRNTEHFKKSIPSPLSVVFIGDSISFYWGQSAMTLAFAEHPNWNDQGLIGQNSSQLMLRFADDVVSQHPKIVHILTGTNDVYPGWVLCGGSAIYDTCGNIKAMVNMAIAAGIQPVLGTIPPWGDGPTASGADPSPDRYQRIDQLNAWIMQYAHEKGIGNYLTAPDFLELPV